ncbi:MAG TPA: hypothetical protein VND89_06820 [Acidimicrobiales bacterium]|nr:hypothetical protein [Acidimicrobiales bacterium]
MASLPTAYFDDRRELKEQFIVARTGFWLSFFRFQGATTHATKVGGAKYTISGFLRRIQHRVTPVTGMPTLPARGLLTQVVSHSRFEQEDHISSYNDEKTRSGRPYFEHPVNDPSRLVGQRLGGPSERGSDVVIVKIDRHGEERDAGHGQ